MVRLCRQWCWREHRTRSCGVRVSYRAGLSARFAAALEGLLQRIPATPHRGQGARVCLDDAGPSSSREAHPKRRRRNPVLHPDVQEPARNFSPNAKRSAAVAPAKPKSPAAIRCPRAPSSTPSAPFGPAANAVNRKRSRTVMETLCASPRKMPSTLSPSPPSVAAPMAIRSRTPRRSQSSQPRISCGTKARYLK
jgi:hypothetical protein